MRKKQHFLQHKERHKNTKETYTDGLNSIGKKVDFAAEITIITRRRALSEKASIHTAKMTAIKITLKRSTKAKTKHE